MRAVVQRVLSAQVSIDGEVVGRCGVGLLLLVAAHRRDTVAEAKKLADKAVGLRIFNDPDGKMNLSMKDIERSGILAVSNFTIYGDTAKNRRPSFMESAPYDEGKTLFEAFVEALRDVGATVETGVFGADMQVELVNDGPVTVILDAPPPAD